MKQVFNLSLVACLSSCASHSTAPANSPESLSEPNNVTASTSNTVPAAAIVTTHPSSYTETKATDIDDSTATSVNASPPVSTAEASTSAQPSVPTSEPDNTRSNRRDRNGASVTPMDQGTSTEDRRITQQIRQAIVKNSSLSFNAKNVKVITLNGKVTLRGPVNSDEERSTIDAAAKKIAGETQVENQLEIRK